MAAGTCGRGYHPTDNRKLRGLRQDTASKDPPYSGPLPPARPYLLKCPKQHPARDSAFNNEAGGDTSYSSHNPDLIVTCDYFFSFPVPFPHFLNHFPK
jgi:hypothetical protein